MFRPIFNSLFERRVGVGDACRLNRASATVAIGALSGGTHAKKSILVCSPHATPTLNILPTADLGELRDPVLPVPTV